MKRSLVIATAAAVVLVGGGTATAMSAASGGGAGGVAGEVGGAAAKPAAARSAAANVTKALDTATSAVPGTVTGVDLEDDGHEWDVDVFGKDGKWHEVTVDSAGARVLNKQVDADEGDDDREQRAPRGASVTVQKAMEAAIKAAPGKVTEVDLEKGHWEVEVQDQGGRGHEVRVETGSGKVTVGAADGSDAADDSGSDDSDASDDAGSDGSDTSDDAGSDD